MATNPEILKYFSKVIFDEIGIIYDEINSFALENRLRNIASELELESIDSLYQLCLKGLSNDIKSFLLDTATNNETSFYRDFAVFEAIEQHIVKPRYQSGTHHFNIWSAACSSGQEVYSLAFLLEELKHKFPRLTYHILGSDISTQVLATAMKGEYSQLEIQRGLPANILIKYLVNQSSVGQKPVWKVKDEIRESISFRQVNLAKPFPSMGPFDLVLCRNVLIYQNQSQRLQILQKIYQKMNPGSQIILGSAERISGLEQLFEAVIEKKAFFYNILPPKGQKISPSLLPVNAS